MNAKLTVKATNKQTTKIFLSIAGLIRVDLEANCLRVSKSASESVRFLDDKLASKRIKSSVVSLHLLDISFATEVFLTKQRKLLLKINLFLVFLTDYLINLYQSVRHDIITKLLWSRFIVQTPELGVTRLFLTFQKKIIAKAI